MELQKRLDNIRNDDKNLTTFSYFKWLEFFLNCRSQAPQELQSLHELRNYCVFKFCRQDKMDPYDEVAIADLGGAAELNELINSQLNINKNKNDDDLEKIDILEKIIFADHERAYNELNRRTTKQVIKSFMRTENGKKKVYRTKKFR